MNDEKTDPKGQDVSKSLDAPRKKHGTRVAFTFVCSKCGVDATLDYKPKGVPVEELLCAECMAGAENSERWKLVRDKKNWEDGQREFQLKCVECGHVEFSSRPGRKGRPHLCQRCKMEQATPNKSRLEGADRLEGAGVMMRRKKKDDDEET